MSTVDKLFKDKLENHSIPPAPQSWEKVEARISKKNNLAIGLRVAAGIALLGIVLTLLFNEGEQTATPSTMAKENIKPIPPENSNETATTPIESDQQVAKVQPQKRQIDTQRKDVAKKNTEPEATKAPELVVKVISESRPTAPSGLTTATMEPEPVKSKRMVLVYSLPSIGKKTEAGVPAEEEEKKTGLQKVMDVAMDVRGSDVPLGELREKKDELFALEFRKDKKSKN